MKYIRATFTNYIGFYNGMNLYKVDVDFSKCKHNIILISGKNGSGKSTLLNHLNPFPDGSTSFIPNKTAEKRLTLLNEDDVYDIIITSPADLNGRKTTKAYIKKNGLELNPNGNVSSYKEIIFSEFELDPNYISLSRLSSSDRGLSSKTPAERKRFASSIIDNLEVYNNIYKVLNKKNLVYKSSLDTLHTKIQNIGDKTALETRLKQLQTRESELNASIMSNNNQIVSIQAKNSIDEEEAREIQEVTDKAEALSNELDYLSRQLDAYYHKTKIDKDSITEKYNSDIALSTDYTNKMNEMNTEWREKSSRLSTVSSDIATMEAEIANSNTNSDIGDRYTESKKVIDEITDDLTALGISTDTSILELDKVLTFCEKFSNMIDRFNDNISVNDIRYLLTQYDNVSIQDIIAAQNKLIDSINSGKENISEINGKIKILSILDERPKECKIDSCSFISEAIALKKSTKTDLIEDLSVIQESILSLSEKVTELQEKIDYHNSLSSKHMELDAIRRLILENEYVLMKFYPDFYANYETLILNLNSFGDIKDHKKIIDGINLLKLLDAEVQNNRILEVEYTGYQEKIKLLNSSRVMIEKLKKEEKDLIERVSKLRVGIQGYKDMIDNINSNITTKAEYAKLYDDYKAKEAENAIIQEKVLEYQKKSSKAIESLSTITSLRSNIENLSAELEPIMKDINTISGQLTLLDSYYEEYNMYKSSYDTISILKKYCSPTAGGIQTLFMQIYMSKTKNMANELLAMMFNGSYQLLDFIINENEFRIPFVGEGLPVDDISSGSDGQKAMMGMIINLVLLNQASTKFNISQLDEINGALDSYNNSIFVTMLFNCMNILNIDQLFLISHSTETDNSFADIIKLIGYDNYESAYQSGNVIWNYEDEVNK